MALSEGSAEEVRQIEMLPILHVKAKPGLGKAGLGHFTQQFRFGASLQTDGGSIRSKGDVYLVPRRLRQALLAGQDFRALRFRDAHGLRLHFGLGSAERADSISVRWPSGGKTVLKDVAADRILTIDEQP